MGFGKNVEMILKYHEMQVAELASAINAPRTTLYSMIKRDAMPAANLALAICETLGVDVLLMCERDLEPRDLELDPGLFVPPRSERSARILNERHAAHHGYVVTDFSARDIPINASLSPEEGQLILSFRKLDEKGQDKLRGYAVDLVASGHYERGE